MLEEFCRYFNLYWSYKVVDLHQFDLYPEAMWILRTYKIFGPWGTTRQRVELHSLWHWNQDRYWEIDGILSRDVLLICVSSV